MQARACKPTARTFASLIDACSRAENTEMALRVYQVPPCRAPGLLTLRPLPAPKATGAAARHCAGSLQHPPHPPHARVSCPLGAKGATLFPFGGGEQAEGGSPSPG